MRYDRGFGPGGSHGGDWTQSYQGGDRGYDRGYHLRDRSDAAVRPWVGSYRGDFQGGSGGYAVNTSGYLNPDRTIAGRTTGSPYDANFARDRERNGFGRRPGGAYAEGGPIRSGGGQRTGYDAGLRRDFREQQMERERGYDWRYIAGNNHPQREGGELRGSMSYNRGIGRWDPWF